MPDTDNRTVFSETFLDHFQHPRNVGKLDVPAITVNVENPACGDLLRLSALFTNDRVSEVRYQVRGCAASIAAGSVLTEWMQDRSCAELAALTPATVEQAIGGLIPESRHAAVLCVDGVKQLLKSLNAHGPSRGR